MWMGFGSTVASNFKCKDPIFVKKYPTSIDYCPTSWINTTRNGGLPEDYEMTTTVAPEVSPCEESGFTMLGLYQVSYMWYSAVACVWCLVVGCLISCIKPTDHKKLDKRFISPALPTLFSFWPAPVKNWIKDYYDEIGSEREENREVKGSHNLGYLPEGKDIKSTHI